MSLSGKRVWSSRGTREDAVREALAAALPLRAHSVTHRSRTCTPAFCFLQRRHGGIENDRLNTPLAIRQTVRLLDEVTLQLPGRTKSVVIDSAPSYQPKQ